MTEKIERRYMPGTEFRVANDESRTIAGYAAMFNTRSTDLGGFEEVIAPGAFKDAIAKSDIRSLFNHDPNIVLGRMKAGTLRVVEDDEGLHIENDLPDTQAARDLLVSMKRGDVTQMSFAFRIAEGGDVWEERDGKTVRTITKVAELFDVSPVTYPAYPDTTVAVRRLDEWKSEQAPAAEPEPTGGSVNAMRQKLAA